MTSHYDLPAGRLGDALDRAMVQAVRTPPAHEPIFEYPGLIAVDWNRAATCHHSNVPVVGTVAAMIDPVAAAHALGKIRLASIVGGVSRLDQTQRAILAAAAGHPGAEQRPQSYFGRAVRAFIEAEALQDYFEISPAETPGKEHHGIRPAGYAESEQTEAVAFARGERPPARDLFEEMRQRAARYGLDPHRRVALVALMALYNEHDTLDRFKGRGWVFTARDLGEYLKNRAARRPATFEALFLAMATYHGW